MIIGAHVVIYSRDAEADRAFFRDVLGFPSVDAGGGWLIFALPPAEVAMHPHDASGQAELYLMCEDVEALVRELAAKAVPCSAIADEPWGRLTHLTLPGGGRIGIYQPRHPMAIHQGSRGPGA